MKTDTAEKIIQFIDSHGQATAKQLYDYLQISPQAVFRQLKRLVSDKVLTKQGKSPKVFYRIFGREISILKYDFPSGIETILNQSFYTVTPSGEEKRGVEGFVYWCEKRQMNIAQSAKDYCSILKKCESYRLDGLIDGLFKIKTTFKKIFLDSLYYQDFYAYERFGKTKLGQMLLYAKQSQDKMQIEHLVQAIKPSVSYLVKKYKIDGVGFIPPTVKRQVQLMTEIERGLRLKVRRIPIIKIKTPVIVPQKTLNKLGDRIENAAHTIIIEETKRFHHVLLIDDAVGSGATLNETARHLRDRGAVNGKIVGFSVTGSFKGFDVISEV